MGAYGNLLHVRARDHEQFEWDVRLRHLYIFINLAEFLLRISSMMRWEFLYVCFPSLMCWLARGRSSPRRPTKDGIKGWLLPRRNS